MPPKRAGAKAPPPPQPAASNPSPALQRARMHAALKMHKYRDVEKEKALVEQWEKKEPARRITKKSSVARAQDAEPDRKYANQHEANKL